MNTPDLRVLAQWAKEFRETEFGQYFLEVHRTSLDDVINMALYTAETAEQKALLVERAAGIKQVLKWIDRHAELTDAAIRQLEGKEEEPRAEDS